MSRMLALRSPHPATVPEAVLEQFLALALVHSDGWGYAGIGPEERLRTATGMMDAVENMSTFTAMPQTAALHYLRLASADSPIVPANLQPFRDSAVTFMHNGALVPHSLGLAALTASERRRLRGTSDSEIYFALVRRELASGGGTIRDRVSRAVAETRELYPSACLNAMMLVDGALVIIASRGTAPAPLAALAARGFALDPADSDTYNRLFRTRADNGAHLVATSGIDVVGWDEIPDGEVLVL